jgi:hypothetical protein
MLKFLAPLVARLGLSSLIPGAGLLSAAGSMLSAAVAFFSTPAGKWVGIALIGAGLYVVGDVHRGRLDQARFTAKWEAAVRRSELERSARDEAIKREVSADADRRIAEIQRESDQLQTKVAEYEQALSASNAVACLVSPDDARRLRELGYAPVPDQSRGTGGVRSYLARGRAAVRQGR